MGFDTSEYVQAQTTHLRSLLEEFDRKVFADQLDPTVAQASNLDKAGSTRPRDAAEDWAGGPARPVRMMPDRQVNRPVEEQVVEWANAFPHFRVVGRRPAQTETTSDGELERTSA